MARVAVIGCGTSSMIFAHALLQSGQGHEVTVYSDRSAESWLNDVPPTGTAALFAPTLDIERELGLDHWTEKAHAFSGILLDFKPTLSGPERLSMCGSFGRPGAAVDMRLRLRRWMDDFEGAGGALVVESVGAERADEIAGAADLTVAAVGKGDIGRAIPRDDERSVYDRPQRKLCMVILEGIAPDRWDDRVDFTPVKFDFFGDTGECFWVPFEHKTAGRTWCVVFEAKPGGAMDVFDACRSASDATEQARAFMEAHAPWDWEIVRDMKPVGDDPHCWLKGGFPPTVRAAFGRTASGHLLMPMGDTAITFDPIGGQGGNCAARNAKFIADRVIEQDGERFDEDWMSEVRERFWEHHGKAAYTFNNLLLEPLMEPARIGLMAAARNRAFADRHFVGNFATPTGFFPWILDADAARAKVAPYLEP